MSKTVLLFAGQGAQAVGMGKDLAEKFPPAKTWFDRANTALGYDLASVCFNGPDAELTKTENAQPGIFLVSWVAFQLLKEHAPTLSFQAADGCGGSLLKYFSAQRKRPGIGGVTGLAINGELFSRQQRRCFGADHEVGPVLSIARLNGRADGENKIA